MATGSRPFAVHYSRPLGKEVPASQYKPLRDLIGGLERSQTGNLIIRAGTELEEGGWERNLHIVLNEDEVRDLISGIHDLFPEVRRG